MSHRIVGSDVGTTPIFNWLLYGYGVPALSFWFAGYLLRKRDDDVPARIVDSRRDPVQRAADCGLKSATTLHERRHLLRVEQPAGSQHCRSVRDSPPLIGLEHVRRRSASVVHNIGAIVVAVLTLAAIVFRAAARR